MWRGHGVIATVTHGRKQRTGVRHTVQPTNMLQAPSAGGTWGLGPGGTLFTLGLRGSPGADTLPTPRSENLTHESCALEAAGSCPWGQTEHLLCAQCWGATDTDPALWSPQHSEGQSRRNNQIPMVVRLQEGDLRPWVQSNPGSTVCDIGPIF